MSIVSDDNVTDALTYLAIDPHPLALAKKYIVDAENKSKLIYANHYRHMEGTLKERDSQIECLEAYRAARNEEAEAILELERHKARSRAAEMLIEVWRSENANVRAAERIR